MRTVILAGGLGTRLAEETIVRPKPMVSIGEHPILWHIMKLYEAQGFSEFVIALGHKGEQIKDYFYSYHTFTNALTVDLRSGTATVHNEQQTPWLVHLVDTGLNTQTGGRLKALGPRWIGDQTFMLTYGDGLGDVDLRKLLAFHRSHGKLATVTAVRPPARFGAMEFDGDRVERFSEKPQAGEGWINGGFFVLEPAVLDLVDSLDTVWEREPLERLAARGELMAYRHAGFWQPMDTLRERRYLEELWAQGDAPWKLW